MALPLLPILLLGGAAVAVVVVATRGSRFALSEDCQTNKLESMTPEEVQEFFKTTLAPAFKTVFEGKGVISMRAAAGETVPEFAIEEIAACQAELVAEGLSDAEAKALCRIDGTTVYYPAEPDDPAELAMYLYQQIVPPGKCAFTMKNWASDDKEVVWPSIAAECLYAQLEIVMKMELLATTLDEKYAITPDDLLRVAELCPQARAAWVGPGTGPKPGTGRFAGVSVGAAAGLDYASMAHDANSGLLHPAHVLSGAVFR